MRNIWRQPIDGRPAEQITRFLAGQYGFGYEWTHDGSRLFFNRFEQLVAILVAQTYATLTAMAASKANGFGMARRLHARALYEYRAASAVNDRIGIRQAAEKGWLSSVEATKALLRARGRLAPGGTGRQRDELVKLGRANKKARDLPRLFALARETLHISCFYDDEFTPATIEAVLEDAGELIGLAEKVAAAR